MREVARQYVKELRSAGWEAERADPDVPCFGNKRVLRHALWLCEQIAEDTALAEAKAMRWLGFVQGILWVLGSKTISEMKNHNRPTDPRYIKENG